VEGDGREGAGRGGEPREWMGRDPTPLRSPLIHISVYAPAAQVSWFVLRVSDRLMLLYIYQMNQGFTTMRYINRLFTYFYLLTSELLQ